MNPENLLEGLSPLALLTLWSETGDLDLVLMQGDPRTDKASVGTVPGQKGHLFSVMSGV